MDSTLRDGSQVTPSEENLKERIKLELGLLTEEYKALKAEIVQNLGSGRQITALSLTALGLLVFGAKPLGDPISHTQFLFIPFVFYALAWSRLRYVAMAQEMGKYLRDKLTDKVKSLLKDHPGGPAMYAEHIFEWEQKGRGLTRLYEGWQFWLFLPIAGANFGIPLLGAVFSLGMFLVSAVARTIAPLEWVLLAVNVLALVYSALWARIPEQKR